MIPSLAVVVLAAAVASAPAPPISTAFVLDPMWDDESSEVATYSTTRPGNSKSSLSRIVIKKIPGRPSKPSDTLQHLQTMFATYSSEIPATGGALESIVMFDGKTFQLSAELVKKPSRHLRRAKAGEIFYDGLPIWLRGLDLTKPARFPVSMWLSQISGDSLRAKPVSADVEVIGPAGRPSETSRGGLEVDVRYEEKVDRLWFHPGPGHILLVWEKADSTTLTLSKNQRVAYVEDFRGGAKKVDK